MKIQIVSHYFPPEIGAPQARLSELARYWAEAGDEVTVLTGLPNHPTGVIPPEYRGRLRFEEHADGYRVLRSWLYATPNEGITKKTLGHLSFMVSSVMLNGRRAGRADVVIASSPTFFTIFSAWFLARVRQARFVVEIRDLWPAIFVELGVLKNRQLIWFLERLEMAAYRAADEVVVVSEGFRENLIRRGIPAAKVHTIRNGADVERFQPQPADPRVRAELGAKPGDTLVLYIGAHGISHGLTSVADSAALLGDDPVHFAFVGEGAAKAALHTRVLDLGLRNVTLLPGVDRSRVPGMLAAADICLAPLRDVPLFTTFIPSKIFEYLAAGRPVVGALRGEPAQIVREAGGVVVPPEAPVELANAIRRLAADRDERQKISTSGRAYVQQHCNRRLLARRYRSVLNPALRDDICVAEAGQSRERLVRGA